MRNKQPIKHREAFCLMKYRDAVGNEEIIWNSRDGVTPFIVRNKQGNEAQHVKWNEDVFAPEHKPVKGDRIFADLTPERARDIATRRVEQWWAGGENIPPMSEYYDSKDEAIESIIAGMYHGGESVDLIEVITEAGQ